MGTQVAGANKLDIVESRGHVVAHRALGDHQDFFRPFLDYVVLHLCRRTDKVGNAEYVWRALRVRDDGQVVVAATVGLEFLGREALVHLAVALPGDDFDVGLLIHVGCQVLVRQEDDPVRAQ